MNPLMANWDGMRTATGLNLIIDKHLAAETTEEANLACAYLLENVRLPKDQVAVVMMERARSEAANDAQPWKLVYMLRRMEKMIDRNKQGKEVVGFIASYLNDRRFTEPSYRGREAVPREQRRVCDGATSALIHYLEEKKLCEKYDARFGDPSGESTWERRDTVIQAVVKVLQEKGFLAMDFWQTLPPPKASDGSLGTSSAPPTVSLPKVEAKKIPSSAPQH